MKTINLECELLSDIIISQKAATEGNHTTLDFIPGSNFLGICAKKLYNQLDSQKSFLFFHTNYVKFGDAQPYNSESETRALKAPLSMFYNKFSERDIYLWDSSLKVVSPDIQLKQVRGGYYFFDESKKIGIKANILTSFSIKSAYDEEKRKSKDTMLFGYEALRKGSKWNFGIVFDDTKVTPKDAELIKNSILGLQNIGKSKSAQYGLVKITEIKTPVKTITHNSNDGYLFLYAESRLMFLDEYGIPTFTPKAEDFGFSGYDICYENTQIRTFQYAPYNTKRGSRDSDRCGIEKGSVICLKSIEKEMPQKASIQETIIYVGCYQNEGFGKILINPSFLERKDLTSGKALFDLMSELDSFPKSIQKATKSDKKDEAEIAFLSFLEEKRKSWDIERDAIKVANTYIENNKNKFKGDQFASQWGNIRKIVQNVKSADEFRRCLFDNQIGYLCHGIASEEWAKRGRKESFEKLFTDELISNENYKIIVINISSEMAKEIRR